MEIVARVEQLDAGTDAVLATVIDVRGSGYRLPGARMLMLENGDTFGTVSGGCLEADVMERAKRVLKTRKTEVFIYDTTAEENSVFSLNMGCRGVIRILLEPISKTSGINKMFTSVWKDRRKRTMATFIGGDAGENLEIGARIFVGPDGKISPDGKAIVDAMPEIDDDLETFYESEAVEDTMRYVNKAGEAEFAFESLLPPVMLFILGAGADAVPLAAAAHDLGWQVRVYDHRPAFLTQERFPDADEVRLTERNAGINAEADNLTAIISMNHNYDRDKGSIAAALRTKAFYIGALGPKKRTEQILDELRGRGEVFPPEALARLRYPAGLDIGGDTPESIAISIVAEIQSVSRDRPGGPLRDRKGSIYDRK